MYRFGPFTLDPRRGELRKEGRPVRLQPQPASLLVLLVGHAGEIVTREEIQQILWSDGTIVDFDQSINFCVKRIREALGDASEKPKFVETVPRRGYRFIAPLDSEPALESQPKSPRWVIPVVLAGLALMAAVLTRNPVESTEDVAPPETRPFTSFEGNESWPAFSPDGRQIAYASDMGGDGFWHIYVQLVAGGEPLQLTNGQADDLSPSWSPDGGEIAFTRDVSPRPRDSSTEAYEILAVRALGGTERVLSRTATFAKAAWHPDNEHLVIDGSNHPPTGLVLLSQRDGETRSFTSPPQDTMIWDHSPVFSPDGKSLAFLRGPASSGGSGELHVISSAGGEPQKVTFGLRPFRGFDWTPNGQALVYASPAYADFETRLWKVDLAGGEPVLLEGGDGAWRPTLSGHRLAYTLPVQDLNIWRVSGPNALERSTPEKLIASTRDDFVAEYSPDGTEIAFLSDRDGEHAVWIADASGHRARKLHPGWRYAAPRWSPAGDEITFSARDSNDHIDVLAIDPRGGVARHVSASASVEVYSRWSPDGNWMYFQSLRNATWEIWRSPSEGGKAVQITDGGGQFPLVVRDRVYYWWEWAIRSTGLEGGQATTVLANAGLNWTVWNEKVLYVQSGSAGKTIELLDPETGDTREIARVGNVPATFNGLSVSPDGQWILYTQNDHPGADIMLVENFDP